MFCDVAAAEFVASRPELSHLTSTDVSVGDAVCSERSGLHAWMPTRHLRSSYNPRLDALKNKCFGFNSVPPVAVHCIYGKCSLLQ